MISASDIAQMVVVRQLHHHEAVGAAHREHGFAAPGQGGLDGRDTAGLAPSTRHANTSRIHP
jgi:hypothetical protein